MFTSFESGFSEGEMGVGGCGNDNYVDGGVGEHLVRRRVNFGIGVVD